MEAIEVPEHQLQAIKSTSQEVLINVCDQVVERTSKCLTQRSRPNIAQIITIDELCSMAKIVDLLNQESMRMTNRVSNGLALSLQVCTVFYCYFPQCGKTRNSLSRKEIFREINYLESVAFNLS